jgi:anaerobic magnesium-protoporphyrin IX monomethyl ester cyclase
MRRAMRQDAVLVNPATRETTYQDLGRSLAAIENPVWAGLIATFARRHGVGVEVVDAAALGLSPAETATLALESDSRLVVIVVYGHQPSASTQNMVGAGRVAKAIKEQSPGTKVLMVGGHVAALPERTLHDEACDFVAIDEGLWTVVDLVTALKAGEPDLGKVRGLGFWSDGPQRVVRLNRAAPLVQDLDGEIPGLAWDLLPMDRYRAHNWHCFGHLQREPYAAIYTTLGCPYRCTFCCIHAPFRAGAKELGLENGVNSYRYWSPQRVIDEIDLLVTRYGVRNIKFADELFVLNARHVLGICDLIIERGYDLNIWAYARVDTVKDGMIDTLKRAGVNWLAFGIEAASDRVLTNVAKRLEAQQVHDTVRRVRDAGINVIGNYIVGLPEDDHASMQDTLDLALELNCEFANFYSTMAYPGSPLYQEAVAKGWPLPETWSGYAQHAFDTFPLPTKYLSPGEVLQFRDDAFRRYFSNPAYLDMITRKFGEDTAAHVRDMTRLTLDRKHVQPRT